METAKLSKAIREYNAIRNNSSLTARQRILSALAFDADGRPGAQDVRDLQHKLRASVRAISTRVAAARKFTAKSIHLHPQPYPLGEAGEYLNTPQFRARRRERAWAAKGAQWLEDINLALFEIRDAEIGSPSKCFGLNIYQGTPTVVDLFELPAGASGCRFARVNGWLIRTSEQEDLDWSAYSKAWHRAHGPKRTIHSRKVEIRRVNEAGTVEIRDIAVDGWRGHWVLNSLIQAGVIESPKVPAKLRSVQLHAAYGVREVRRTTGATFYERTLAGKHHDYCVVWHGLTYHAATQRECLKGLRLKLAEAERRQNATIDFKFCRELGFCEDGIKTFAAEFSLDVKGQYTAEEIAERVKGNLPAAAPFAPELKKLAAAVDYQIQPELEGAYA